MTESAALTELREVIARKEFIIRHKLVVRAIHDMFDVSLEAANSIEDLLREAGYEQSKRGDWALFD
jgi:hypothetical protein